MPEESSMRRQPKQARSRQRVDHLLNVAATVFEEIGYANATTNAIAARAGMSIASLYQFFPNKEAILEALVERYLDEMQQVPFLPGENLPITVKIQLALERLEGFHESHAGYRALFLGTAVEHRIHDVLIQLIETALAQSFPALDAALRRQTALVWLAITIGMTSLSKPPYDLSKATAQAETQVALAAYLRAVLIRAKLPLPDDLQEG
jgi:AcrR family transcriptional regulator